MNMKKIKKFLTVKELKEKLENLNDNDIVRVQEDYDSDGVYYLNVFDSEAKKYYCEAKNTLIQSYEDYYAYGYVEED